jgi:hypothetical protein
MKTTTAWAWAGPVSIGAYLGVALLVRLRIADFISYRFICFFTAGLFLLCLIGATYLARRKRGTVEMAGFWINICCVLLWAIVLYGLATYPSQQ